jgi:hypothetical protein
VVSIEGVRVDVELADFEIGVFLELKFKEFKSR